jgi:hypothetical protein
MESDAFIFSLGNIISTCGVAFFAIIVWKIQQYERDYNIYVDKLQHDYLKEEDAILLKWAHCLSKEDYLDKAKFIKQSDKDILKKIIKLDLRLKKDVFKLLIILLVVGVLIQSLSLIYPFIVSLMQT